MPTDAGPAASNTSADPASLRGNRRPLARIAAPEPRDTVAEPVVPLRETRRVIAELVTARTDIPGFGDQLHAGQQRILTQGVEETGAGIEAVDSRPRVAPRSKRKPSMW